MSIAPEVTHKPTRAVLEALLECGWMHTATPFPGNAIWSHPRSGEEMPTPDYMRGSPSWPFDTFYRLRQISYNHDGLRISAVWSRECGAPWVSASERRLSFKAAAAFIREEWAP